MSIYITLWSIKVSAASRIRGKVVTPKDQDDFLNSSYITVYAQMVPPWIGDINNDPYSDFLPPPVDYDPENLKDLQPFRAVVIVQRDRNQKEGQRYIDPLITLSGPDYMKITWHELLEKITKSVK